METLPRDMFSNESRRHAASSRPLCQNHQRVLHLDSKRLVRCENICRLGALC